MPPLTTTMNKLLNLMSHRKMIEMKIPNNLLRVKVINKVVIRASTSLLPSSLLPLMLNLIIPTMLPKQLYKNVVNSYTIAINTMTQKLSNWLCTNWKMDLSTRVNGKMVWDMVEVNNSGRMVLFTKVTGRTIWLTERVDLSTPMLMVNITFISSLFIYFLLEIYL